MKRFRLLLLAAAALVLVLVAAIAVLFNSSFQTWAVRKALASRPDIRVSVSSVDAGMKRVQLEALRFEHDGATLTVPRVEVDVPLLAAGLSKDVRVSRLVAKGWTLDLSKKGSNSTPNPFRPPVGIGTPGATGSGVAPTTSSSPAASAVQAFAGIFGRLELPFDLTVDGVELEGVVILPEDRGRTKLKVAGGGLRVRGAGKFELTAEAELTDPAVNRVEVKGEVTAQMDTPRTFTRFAATLDASARGAKFPQGVTLRAELGAARNVGGETYTTSVVAHGQEIVQIKAEYPRTADKLAGTWKLDVRHTDVAPFALGQPLPTFEAIGQGVFDTDARFAAVRAGGHLTATADKLEMLATPLAGLGTLKLSADFDLAEQAGALVVQRLEAAVTSTEPVATVRALQPFAFNPATGEMRTTDTSKDLFGVTLQGLPIAWIQRWLQNITVTGGVIRGEIVGTARAGGVSLRSTAPLALESLDVAHAGKPLLRGISLSLGFTGDYTPKGWQVEVRRLVATSSDGTLLTLDAKAGQLVGNEQPIKTTGRLGSNLPAILNQPVAEKIVLLSAGDAAIDFVASLGKQQQVEAKVALTGLSTVADKKTVTLPDVSLDLRADLHADGKIAFNLPLLLTRDQRKSDLTIVGSVGPEKDKARAIEAQASGALLIVDDAKLLAALVPPDGEKKPQSPTESRAPWAGIHGSMGVQIGRVVYSDTFEVLNLNGNLRLDAGVIKLEGMQAGLGDTGRASINGSLTFDGKLAHPYGLAAEFALREFDPAPLFRASYRERPPTVEGRFDVTSTLASRALTLGDLASGAGGDFKLTSKGGIFRGLPVDARNLAENTGRIAGWIASAGTALGAMTGKKEYSDIANRAQAVEELARGLNPIPYDQLSVTISRDAALNTTLKDFTLIAPEVRLNGQGTALHQPGATLLEDSLAMEFQLRARGRHGELLKYVGALDPQTDDLGYAKCTLPLKIGGTLGKPDTGELNTQLAALALEKSGVTDRASEIFNRVFGGGK